MRTDRELLELAAKAVGICESLEWFEKENCFVLDNVVWNPIADDGDALRLAVTLNIDFYSGNDEGAATFAGYFIGTVQKFAVVQHNTDPYAATRRAIVHAATEIGGQS